MKGLAKRAAAVLLSALLFAAAPAASAAQGEFSAGSGAVIAGAESLSVMDGPQERRVAETSEDVPENSRSDSPDPDAQEHPADGMQAESEGVLTEPEGTLIQPEDVPSESKGAQTEPKGAQTEPKDALSEPKDAPSESKDTPSEPGDAPSEPKDTPSEPEDAPSKAGDGTEQNQKTGAGDSPADNTGNPPESKRTDGTGAAPDRSSEGRKETDPEGGSPDGCPAGSENGSPDGCPDSTEKMLKGAAGMRAGNSSEEKPESVRVQFHANGGEINGSDNAPGYNRLDDGTWSFSPGGSGTYPMYRTSKTAPKGWIEVRKGADADWEMYYETVSSDEYSHDLTDVSRFGVRRRQYTIIPESAYNRKSDGSGNDITETGGAEHAADTVRINDGVSPAGEGIVRGLYVRWVSAPRVTVRYDANGGTIAAAAGSYPQYRVADVNGYEIIQKKENASSPFRNYTDTVYDDGYQYDLTDTGPGGFGLTKAGSSIEAANAYNTKKDGTGMFITQGLARATAATAKRINGGQPVTSDMTVTLYAAWRSSAAVTVRFSANGGTIRTDPARYPQYRTVTAQGIKDLVEVKKNASSDWEVYQAVVPLSAGRYDFPAEADRLFGAERSGFHIRDTRLFNTKADGSGTFFTGSDTKETEPYPVNALTLNGGKAGTVTLYAAWESDDAKALIRLHSNRKVTIRKPRGDEPDGKPFDSTVTGEGGEIIRSFSLPWGKAQQLGNMPISLPDNYVTDGISLGSGVRAKNEEVYITFFYLDGFHPAGWTTEGGQKVSYSGRVSFTAPHLHYYDLLPAEDDRYSAIPTITMQAVEAYDGETVDLYCQWLPDIGITQKTIREEGAGSGGVTIKAAGFARQSEAFNGVNLFIPSRNKGEKTELYADGDLAWITVNGRHELTRRGTMPRNIEHYTTAGSASIILKERAYDIYGEVYDVKLTFGNISGNSGDNTSGKMVYFTYYTTTTRCMLDSYGSAELTGRAGRRMDVSIEVLDESGRPTNVLKSGEPIVTSLFFHDIDIPDRLTAPGDSENRYKWDAITGAKADGIAPYAEAVLLPVKTLSLAGNTVYINPPHDAAAGVVGNRMIYEVMGDKSLKLAGSWYSGVESSNTGQNPMVDSYDEGFMVRTLFDASEGFSFSHSGAGCGTALFDSPDFYRLMSNVVLDAGAKPGEKVDGGAGSEETGQITLGGKGEQNFPQGASMRYEITPGPFRRVAGLWIDGVRVSDADIDEGKEGTILLSGFGSGADPWAPVTNGQADAALCTSASYAVSRCEGGAVTFSNIHANHTVDVAFAPYEAPVRITKKRDDTGEIITNAEFTVYEYDKAKQAYGNAWNPAVSYDVITDPDRDGVYVSNRNLVCTSSNEGKFLIVETGVPEGYVGGRDIPAAFEDGTEKEAFTFTVFNRPKKGAVVLKKYDEVTKEPLSGAVFEIYEYDSAKKAFGTSPVYTVTDEDYSTEEKQYRTGNVLVYRESNKGRFRIREKNAPEGYLPVPDDTFTVMDLLQNGKETANGIFEYRFDVPEPPDSHLLKVTKHIDNYYAAFGEATFIFTLEGTDPHNRDIIKHKMVTLTPVIYAEDDPTPEKERIAAEDVTFVWEDLPAGHYTVREESVARYKVRDITGSANVKRKKDFAEIDLTKEDAEVRFTNAFDQYDKASHTHSVTNHIGG